VNKLIKLRRLWKKLAGGFTLLTVLSFFLWSVTPALAATTADVTVTALPSFISITATNTTYDFGVVTEGSVTNTTTAYFPIVNLCSVQSDQTIAAVTGNWTGGTEWIHSDTATAGVVTAGLSANQEGVWGVGDIIVKNADPNYIAENQAATTNYSFGLQLYAPTTFHDGTQKTMVVRITAVAG
jgi:hypothetical protein